MNETYINPFLEALKRVLEQYGISNINIGQFKKKEHMQVNLDVTTIVGLVGDVKGNVAYSLSQDTAKKILAMMMPGRSIEGFDSLARSAIGELANMITGRASVLLSRMGVSIDISPPSIIVGEDIFFIISPVQSLAVDMDTPNGRIEVNIELQ